jgi:tetratricopeptide (TPR) repeat protein
MNHRSATKSLARASLLALTLSIAGAVATQGTVNPAFANPSSGGGGGGGNSGSSSSSGGSGTQPIVCKEGWKLNTQKQICEKEKSSLMNDEDRYVYGRDLALAGYYGDALGVLQAITDQDDAMVLTMIGYSKRKMGNVDEGIAYYHKALAIDPDNINTHEYLGEGYVAMGKKDLALAELNTLEKLCGVDCEQYVELASAINGRSADW